jgi:pimeloyl-ACP methyl ester carboxylesterase
VLMDNDSITNFSDFTFSDGSKLAYRSCRHGCEPGALPEEEPLHVVFCGGFHSNMRGIKAQKLEEICSKNNLSYTRFDYRGHGESEGDPATFSLTDWLNDTLLILDNIHEPIVLVGSSMGGWLATVAATRRPEKIRGLLLLASAPDFLQELVLPRLSKSDSWDLQQGLIVSLPSAYEQPYPLTQKLMDSGQELSVFKPIPLTDDTLTESNPGPRQLTCPIRMIHGTADSDVPFELSIRLMNEFKQAEARLTLLSQADHRLSDERSLACIEHELLMLAIEVGNRG